MANSEISLFATLHSLSSGSRLDLGDRCRHQLIHLGAHFRCGDGDALGGEVLHDLVLDVLVAGFLEQNGVPGVLSLAGGIAAWSSDVDPSVPQY